jgi:hypothetical protein
VTISSEGVDQLELLNFAGRNVNWNNHFENNLIVSYKDKYGLIT